MREAGGSEAAVVPICAIAMVSGPVPPIATICAAGIVPEGLAAAMASAVPPDRETVI